MNSQTAVLATEMARHGPEWGSGPPPNAAVIGVLMCIIPLLIVAGVAFFLLRRYGRPPWAGKGGQPPWARSESSARTSPDDTARQVLAERFAKGDISVEEFLERASALNWYPGDEPGGKS